MRDPYEVLGVPRDASDAHIRYAYRQLMRERTDDGSVDAARFEEIEQAYAVLGDPGKRAAYDSSRAGWPEPETAGHGEGTASHGGETTPAQTAPAATAPAESRTTEAAPTPARAPAREEPRNPFTRLTHRLPRPWRIALDWVLTIAGAILIVLAIKEWVVNPYRIPSSSMEPTLHCARPGSGCLAHFSDRVLANRFIFHFRSPNRGEIVVFETPKRADAECGASGTFVKRLIGLPGERVTERNGVFFVDGRRLDDSSWVKPNRRDHESGSWKVPQGRYFFVGDNRVQSCDSRRWGAVPRKNLIGPVFATYWPPNRISVTTPGPVGGAILGVLGLIIATLIALAVRRRRVR
jgi:signal peptidase I